MRIKIKLSGTKKPITINNQHIVNGFLHKLIGKNNKYHDGHSDYCLSSLRGGKLIGDGKISFIDGGYIIISTSDNELLSKIMIGLLEHKNFYSDINVCGFEYLPEEHYFNGWNHFRTLTPILLKHENAFYTINDDNFVEILTNKTKHKLSCYNPKLSLDDFKIKIKNHPAHKVDPVIIKKKIDGKNVHIRNDASQCHLSIYCSKNVAKALHDIGIGKSTGSGFGMIYKTENKDLY